MAHARRVVPSHPPSPVVDPALRDMDKHVHDSFALPNMGLSKLLDASQRTATSQIARYLRKYGHAYSDSKAAGASPMPREPGRDLHGADVTQWLSQQDLASDALLVQQFKAAQARPRRSRPPSLGLGSRSGGMSHPQRARTAGSSGGRRRRRTTGQRVSRSTRGPGQPSDWGWGEVSDGIHGQGHDHGDSRYSGSAGEHGLGQSGDAVSDSDLFAMARSPSSQFTRKRAPNAGSARQHKQRPVPGGGSFGLSDSSSHFDAFDDVPADPQPVQRPSSRGRKPRGRNRASRSRSKSRSRSRGSMRSPQSRARSPMREAQTQTPPLQLRPETVTSAPREPTPLPTPDGPGPSLRGGSSPNAHRMDNADDVGEAKAASSPSAAAAVAQPRGEAKAEGDGGGDNAAGDSRPGPDTKLASADEEWLDDVLGGDAVVTTPSTAAPRAAARDTGAAPPNQSRRPEARDTAGEQPARSPPAAAERPESKSHAGGGGDGGGGTEAEAKAGSGQPEAQPARRRRNSVLDRDEPRVVDAPDPRFDEFGRDVRRRSRVEAEDDSDAAVHDHKASQPEDNAAVWDIANKSAAAAQSESKGATVGDARDGQGQGQGQAGQVHNNAPEEGKSPHVDGSEAKLQERGDGGGELTAGDSARGDASALHDDNDDGDDSAVVGAQIEAAHSDGIPDFDHSVVARTSWEYVEAITKPGHREDLRSILSWMKHEHLVALVNTDDPSDELLKVVTMACALLDVHEKLTWWRAQHFFRSFRFFMLLRDLTPDRVRTKSIPVIRNMQSQLPPRSSGNTVLETLRIWVSVMLERAQHEGFATPVRKSSQVTAEDMQQAAMYAFKDAGQARYKRSYMPSIAISAFRSVLDKSYYVTDTEQLARARLTLARLPPDCLVNIANAGKPPPYTAIMAAALCVITGIRGTWHKARNLMRDPNTLKRLLAMVPSSIARKNRLIAHKLLAKHTALRTAKSLGETAFPIHSILTWLDVMVGIPIPLSLRCTVPRGLPSSAAAATALLGSVKTSTAELLRARIELASLNEVDMLQLASVTLPPREVSILVATMFMLLGQQPSWPKAQVLLIKPDLPDVLLVLHPGDVELSRLEDVVAVSHNVNFAKMGTDHQYPAVRILARWLSAFAAEAELGVIHLTRDADAAAVDTEVDAEGRARRRRLSQLARAGSAVTPGGGSAE